jgi:dTDP-4-amino-4,6-dideoxygalactose transaminase
MHIPFNKPFISGSEIEHIKQTFINKKTAGNGMFTKLCSDFFESRYKFKKTLLTTSCTDALEMAAILADLKNGDEIIVPSYTFVSTANAFVLRGAKIIFVDSRNDHPGLDENKIEALITSKTKAIVVVHYAGVACDMDKIMIIAKQHNLIVIEDAAQAVNSYYTNKNGEKKILGSIGHFGTISFHETKNISSGEGGLLAINDEKFIERAEIIWEKGTNRSKYFRGEIDKYSWIDIGSSFLMSEINAAFLWGQIQNLDNIQEKRLEIWNTYNNWFVDKTEELNLQLPNIPEYADNNAHMFYIILKSQSNRNKFISELQKLDINCVFHYQSLHSSEYSINKLGCTQNNLVNSDKYSECLVRMPLFYDLNINELIDRIENSGFSKFLSSH